MAAPKLNCSPNLLLILCLVFPFAKAADNITSSEFITDGMLLVSSSGLFGLGFFSPGKSTKRYVGIWYNELPQQNQKVVWVANREDPIEDTTGVLSIKAGNLVIFHGNTEEDPVTVWSSTNDQSTAKYSFAKLLESGNLVLFHEEDQDNNPKVVWESFDYPTNTWFPGMKYGMDNRTGLNRILVSRKSPDDPVPADIFVGIDLKGLPQFKTCVSSLLYWRYGPWNGHCSAGVPEISNSTGFNFTFVKNQDEIDYLYTPYIAFGLHHLFLDEFGVLQRETWLKRTKQWATVWSIPRDRCDVYAKCGVYGRTCLW